MAEETKGAREEALARLVERGVISGAQAAAVGAELDAASVRRGVPWAEVTGYVGGALVLAAVAVFAATAWQDLGEAVQVGLLAALIAVLWAAGTAMAGGPRLLGRGSAAVSIGRRRIAGTLFALAPVAAALATSIAVNTYLDIGTWGTSAAAGAGAAVALAGYALMRSVPGLVVAVVMTVVLVEMMVLDLMQALLDGPWPDSNTIAAGVLGAVWVALAFTPVIRERGTAVGLGATTMIIAAEWLDEPADHIGVLVVAAALFGAHVAGRSRPGRAPGAALVFGIIAVTIGVPQLVWYLTDGELSGALVLLIAGAVLLVSSWLGLRFHRPHSDRRPAPPTGPTAPTGPAASPSTPAPPDRPLPRVDPRDPDSRL